MSAPVPKTVVQEANELLDRGSDVDLHRARRLLQKEVSRDDSDPYTYSLLAEVHMRLGEKQEALRLMQRAVQMSPQDGFLLFNLGAAYLEAGKYEEASRVLQAVQKWPDRPDDPRVVWTKRMARMLSLSSDIGAARRAKESQSTDICDTKSGAEIISELRR